ncbi:esterase/lipase family protein [Spongisporangium articulatum]|uniref:Esterase/lipase family protein n=1 Tax=Spongisporangium articulatum TaxID=3362603 RepID=A0ABW8AJJ5_9ACTN
MRRRLALAACTAVAVAGLVAGTGANANAALNVNWNWAAGFIPNLPNSAQTPPGAENVSKAGTTSSCNWKNSPNKLPLILVHGTWEQQRDNWMAMSPYFKNKGYCVYTLNYGGNPGDVMWGWQGIANSAGQLNAYINRVKAATGATQVDIVGHSQGGVMPRYCIKYEPGCMASVRNFVGLASSNNGTTLSGLAKLGKAIGLVDPLALVQPAAIDQTIGSDFMNKVNSCPTGAAANVCVGDTVKYTVLETNGDQVVTPYTGAFLSKQAGVPASQVTNILVNNQCILETSEHLGMTYSQNVATRAARALDGKTAAKCVVSLPYIGG